MTALQKHSHYVMYVLMQIKHTKHVLVVLWLELTESAMVCLTL